MSLLIGTRDGLFRTAGSDFDDLEQLLDQGPSSAYRFESTSDVFALAGGELYRSSDGGESWRALATPAETVTSVLASPDGERLYIGTHPPAQLYVSLDTGDSWEQLDGFPDLPPHKRWSPEHGQAVTSLEHGGKIRSLRAHPDIPDRLVASIEPVGVYVSDDQGETWTERRYGLHNDVHHLLMLGPNEYIASCGRGLYHTGNACHSWTRLDTSQTFFTYAYFHEALLHDGVLYTAAAADGPGTWTGDTGANTVLLESHSRGETFHGVSYPGGPREFISSWTVRDDAVFAGTIAQDLAEDGTTEARVIRRDDDGTWTTVGTTPASVLSLTSQRA